MIAAHVGVNTPQKKRLIASKIGAYIAVMCALANVMGYFSIPIGVTKFHLMQLPIILSGLALGPWVGGLVGFIGALTMAFNLPSPNLYIILGNAILGFFTGLFYRHLKKTKVLPIIPQMASVLGAYLIQSPYVYLTDVFLMSIAQPLVCGILAKLFFEDVISVFVAHFILYRLDIPQLLSQKKGDVSDHI